jgi:hypothetical protein
MRILEGVGTLLQLAGLVARLCKMVSFLAIVLLDTHNRLELEARIVCHITTTCILMY